MGNSADRDWQLSQLVEGVSTAFNPSHGSLSCVETNCVSFASVQARKRKIRSLLRRGRRARRALFPTCGVVRVAGYSVVWDCDPTPVFLLKSTKRSAAAISRPQRSFITLSWCASDYSIVGRISCYVSHDSTRTNVCQWLFAEIFSLTAAVSNRIDSIRNLFIIFALDFPALENPISEKTNCCIQPSSHSSHASSSSSNQSGLSS